MAGTSLKEGTRIQDMRIRSMPHIEIVSYLELGFWTGLSLPAKRDGRRGKRIYVITHEHVGFINDFIETRSMMFLIVNQCIFNAHLLELLDHARL